MEKDERDNSKTNDVSDDPKERDLKDEDLEQVSGGLSLAICATCGKTVDKCHC